MAGMEQILLGIPCEAVPTTFDSGSDCPGVNFAPVSLKEGVPHTQQDSLLAAFSPEVITMAGSIRIILAILEFLAQIVL